MPASSAPPGRRMPKVTASDSQKSVTYGGALLSVKMNVCIPRNAPANPAIAPENAKSRTLVRPDLMPDASAATSELRTAYAARPEGEWVTAYTIAVTTPKSTSITRI